MKISAIKNHHVARVIIMVVFILVLLRAFMSFTGTNGEKFSDEGVTLSVRDKVYLVEIADTGAERQKGLGGREFLAENNGMLFVFDKPDRYSFWMKDTLIPLDIIWISEDKKIVFIEKNVRPESFPESYSPNSDALYVLELVAGESEKSFLEIGDQVDF